MTEVLLHSSDYLRNYNISNEFMHDLKLIHINLKKKSTRNVKKCMPSIGGKQQKLDDIFVLCAEIIAF